MTLDVLLSHLRQNDIHLWVDGERLRYKGPEQVMTPQVLRDIRDYKSEIIASLLENNGTQSTPPTTHSVLRQSEQYAVLGYKSVGNSGLKVAEFGLGPYSSTMVDPGADQEFSALLDRYVAAGGNHIDLSNVYTRSEKRMGKWLKGRNRDEFVIASKVGFTAGDNPNDIGLSRKHIMVCVEKSLQDLGTDYIDIYYCHVWDGGTPLEETISTFNDLVKAGKVRYLGVSNFTGWQLQKAIDITKYSFREPFICLQTQYNLLDRYPEWEQIPVCKNEGLSLTAWGPLSAGWLTGRYRRGMSPADVGSRVALEDKLGAKHNSFEFKNNERTWATIDALLSVAKELNKTPSQVALNWLKAKSGVIPILGPRNVAQLEDALGSTGWSLTTEQRSRLEDASQMPPIMPHMFVENLFPSDRGTNSQN